MRTILHNKKAFFDYTIIDTLEAGLVLLWHEVKSLKFGHWLLQNAVVSFADNELRLLQCSIPLYEKTPALLASSYNPKQRRKLLVTKKQRARLYERTKKTWLHLVPLKIIETHWRVKLHLWLWKLKKKVQKKQIIKERDTNMLLKKELKKY